MSTSIHTDRTADEASCHQSPPSPSSGIFDDYLNEDEMARLRGVSKRTLRAERRRGDGPPFVKIGRKTLYRKSGFKEHLKAIEQRPTRARKAARHHTGEAY
jgi:hypothetical protein